MKYVILFTACITLSSCCVYKQTRKFEDRQISEIGISSYKNRPISQECPITIVKGGNYGPEIIE